MDFIRGEYSSVLSKERMQQIAGMVKTLRRVVTIPAGYHHLMLDQPLTLVSVLSALLTDG
jgi:pimeloyl-ACP methyl ester carboxylesterase